MMGNKMQALKSVEETAEALGLAVGTLNKWRVQGGGPKFVRLGRRVAYRIVDIEDFISNGLRRSTSEKAGAA